MKQYEMPVTFTECPATRVQHARIEAMIAKLRGVNMEVLLGDEEGFGTHCPVHGFGHGDDGLTCDAAEFVEEPIEGAAAGDGWAKRAANYRSSGDNRYRDREMAELHEAKRDELDNETWLGGAPGTGEYAGLEMMENVRRRRAGLGERAVTWGMSVGKKLR